MKKPLKPFEEWPFRVPSIEKEVAKVNEFVAVLQAAKDEKEALSIIKKHNKASDRFANEVTHVQVCFSLDTKNKKYKKAQDVLNEKLPLYQGAEVAFAKAVVESPFRPFLEQKLGTHIFEIFEFALKSFDDKIVPEMIEENKLSTEYDELVASAEIPFRGGTYNLSQMGKFMIDLDRETRKEAAAAYYGYLSTIADRIEEIYGQLVEVRDRMAKKMGFASYVELGYLRMTRFDYNAQDVAGYREQIREVVTPLAGKLLKARFARTGIKKPEIYDIGLCFKEGNATPKGTTQEKIETAKGMYDAMSPETSYFFRLMADTHVLDLEARAGKQPGGYMTYFPVYEIPFIFSNFNGTAGDVDVLTHEFGHSFQAYMSRNIKVPEYRSPSMESCEIHSMSMEFFAHPYMDRFFDNPERYRYEHLDDSISFLPYGVTVDEFQHWVYENPKATAKQRDDKWHELEEKYTPYKVACYGDCEYLKRGRRWLTQGHIFSSPFYYIDYTLAQVMAFQFFNLDRKNHDLAWKRYLRLCAMGGKYPFRELVKRSHMKDPFEEGTIKKAIQPLLKELKGYKI